MSDRKFEMRLDCRYTEPESAINQVSVESLIEDEWQPLDLTTRSPGFQLFNYGLFSCQHLYFRTNAAERGLMLESATAHISVETDINWNITTLDVEFRGILKSGSATKEAIDYILERMALCPVSSNMKTVADNKRSVTFDSSH